MSEFKCEEETYCETISMQMNQKPSTSKIKTEPMDEQKEINESVIALTKNTNEVITVSESQATQEIYQHVLDNKNQSISDTQTGILRRSPRKLKYSSDECEACNEVTIFNIHLQFIFSIFSLFQKYN